MKFPRFRALAARAGPILAGLAVAGCATTAERLMPADAAWVRGDPVHALAVLDDVRPDLGSDVAVADLDRAMALLALGRFRESAQAAEGASRLMASHEEGDVGEWALAGIGDDTSLAWEGADHEKVLALAVASLALMLDGQPDEARALAFQINRLQERLMERAVLPVDREDAPRRTAYRRFALGEVLQALVDETRGHFDEAALGYERATRWDPSFEEARRSLERVRRMRLVNEEGRGAVVVLFLAGPGPVLEERAEPVTSLVLMVASSILNSRKGSGFPSQAPVLVPVARARPSQVHHATVESADGALARTEVLLDVGAVAAAQMQDDLPRVILRAVLRRAFKEFTKNQVKSAVRGGRRNDVGGLLVDVGGFLWTASERADTRCWSFLPSTFQMARLELPVGRQVLRIVTRDRNGALLGPGTDVAVDVSTGGIRYVVAFAPHPGSPIVPAGDGVSR